MVLGVRVVSTDSLLEVVNGGRLSKTKIPNGA
jgi:hypothetical protein